MTVHARRYGRWCREHFDAIAAEGVPGPRPAEAAEKDTPAPEPAQAGSDEPPVAQR